METMSSRLVFFGFPDVQGSSKAIGDIFSISLSLIFADSEIVCGILICSFKSITQSTNELNYASFTPKYSLSFAILFSITGLLKVRT